MADARRPYPLSDNEIELLSAYLDGALNDAERAALEVRLNAEPALRRELDALRQTVALIKTLPTMKAPRNFTLTREMLTSSETAISDAPRMSKFAVRDGLPAKPARLFVFPTTAAFSALSAAAAVILLVIGVGFFTQSQQSTSSNVAMAITEAAATNDEESLAEVTGTLDDSVLRQASPAETEQFFLFAEEPETATGESADAFAESAPQPATAQDSAEAQEIEPVDPSAMTGMMAFGTPTPASTLFLIPTMMNTFTPAELTQIAVEAAAAAAMDQAMLEGGGITGAGGAGAQAGGGGMEGDGMGGGGLGPTGGLPPAPSQQNQLAPGMFAMTATVESTGTAEVTASPTMTNTAAATPSPTATDTPAPTSTPTPPPTPAASTPNNLLGIGLIGAALVLFALALGTTLIRRARKHQP